MQSQFFPWNRIYTRTLTSLKRLLIEIPNYPKMLIHQCIIIIIIFTTIYRPCYHWSHYYIVIVEEPLGFVAVRRRRAPESAARMNHVYVPWKHIFGLVFIGITATFYSRETTHMMNSRGFCLLLMLWAKILPVIFHFLFFLG